MSKRPSLRDTFTACLAASAVGCGTPPPPSQVPSVRAALDRVHGSQACGLGVQASAKIDHFGSAGRVRGDLLMFALWPAKVRMDAISPFGVTLATLTSNGTSFALSDLREKKFLVGPASACNMARLTAVSVPGHVLVSLLRGDTPALKHDAARSAIAWSPRGYYVITIAGANATEQEIHVAPHPNDTSLDWQKQRFRVLEVVVKQQGIVLFRAELADHRSTETAKPRVDPEGIDPPIMPSGPPCQAELPRRIRVEVPTSRADVLFRYDDVVWNPPLVEGLFTQPVPSGVEVERVTCDE